MKKLIVASLLMTLSLFASKPNMESMQNLPILKQAGVKIDKVQEIDGLYQVKGTSVAPGGKTLPVELFLTKNYKYLIMGRGVNSETGQPIRFPFNVSTIEGKEAFSYGTGKTTLYVFTDPECPYCKKFEKLMPNLKDKYTFRVFLFPLPNHSEAIPMSKYIMAGATNQEKFDRMQGTANGDKSYMNFKMSQIESQKLDNVIQDQITLGKESDIRGTPTVMRASGELVGDWTQL